MRPTEIFDKVTKRVCVFQNENDREIKRMEERFDAKWEDIDPDIPHAVLKKRSQH